LVLVFGQRANAAKAKMDYQLGGLLPQILELLASRPVAENFNTKQKSVQCSIG
jgi:hypothetical protein